MSKFIFNWNAIAKLDPEFAKKYLTDVNKKLVSASPLRLQEEQDIREDAPITDVMGALEPRVKGVNEEELDIILEMHSVAETKQDRPHWNAQAFQRSHKNREDARYIPIPTSTDYSGRKTIPPTHQLLPPKQLLEIGSRITLISFKDRYLHYAVNDTKYRSAARTLIKTSLTTDDVKIRVVIAEYWCDPLKNISKDQKGAFRCITYNKQTHRLYYVARKSSDITTKKGKIIKRYKTLTRSIFLKTALLQTALFELNLTALRKFTGLVEEAVLKDVPDAIIPRFQLKPNTITGRVMIDNKGLYVMEGRAFILYKITLLQLQHKLGHKVDWFTPTIYENLQTIFPIGDIENPAIKRSIRRRQHILSKLRKKPTLKTFTRCLTGPGLGNLLKGILEIDTLPQNIFNSVLALEDPRMPKYIIHDLLHATANNDKSFIAETLNNTCYELYMQFLDYRIRVGIIPLVKSWAKFHRRTNQTPPWIIWRDLYNMAKRLQFGVNPNKFKSVEDVENLHNTFAEWLNRDRKVQVDYKNAVFLDFKSPDVEYSGFKFVQLRTAPELVEEGTSMHHCVGGYAPRCVAGHSIIFAMRKGGRSYVTIELSGHDLSLLQKYTIKDITVTSSAILEIIEQWHHDIRKIHAKDESNYKDQCQLYQQCMGRE